MRNNHNTTTTAESTYTVYTARTPRERSCDPFCVACHRRMRKWMVGYWKCQPCGVACKRERIGGGMFSTPAAFNPWCLACQKRMSKTVCQQTRRRRYICRNCYVSAQEVCNAETPEPPRLRARSTKPRRIDTGTKLLALIDPFVREYPLDVRDELRSAVVIAVLSHKRINGVQMARKHVNTLTVRVIARPILRARPNRFRFVSLDTPTRVGEGNLAEGESLAARLVG